MIHKPSAVAVANIIRNFRGIIIYETHIHEETYLSLFTYTYIIFTNY